MEMLSHKITVEELSMQDIDWFVDTVVKSMVVDELKRPELFDRPTLYNLVQVGVDAGSAFIARKGDEKIGGIGGLLVPHIFNPNIKVLVELAWYVSPEFRRGRAGFMLVKAFVKKAEECADESTLSLLASSQVNHSSLSKLGFSANEVGFLRKHRK